MVEVDAVKPANILAVDDTPANLQVLTGMLKVRGYKVRPVTSGALALRAARQELPDLILLDINMPDMNGYEVCRIIKADETLKRVPVIFISALNEQLDKVNAFGFGGVDYLTKPFQIDELHVRVEAHLKISRLQLQLESVNALLRQVNERMSRDLKAAAKIQRTFLPRGTPSMPGVRFAWAYHPCDELAGDGLNVIPLGDGYVGLYVLDVSGHGVTAALLSVTLSRLLSPASDPSSILVRGGVGKRREEITPAGRVLDELNRLFPFDAATAQFATLLYGVLNTATGEFRYASAGHPGPIHLAAGRAPVVLESQGSPIGLGEDAYEERMVVLGAGDRLYLFSDGVTDAMNPVQRVYGWERLAVSAQKWGVEPLEASIEGILEEVRVWQGGGRAEDDMSILAVEVG